MTIDERIAALEDAEGLAFCAWRDAADRDKPAAKRAMRAAELVTDAARRERAAERLRRLRGSHPLTDAVRAELLAERRRIERA